MKIFDKVKVSAPGSNAFDLNHQRKLTCDMGKLIPILVQEALPGDRARVESEIFIRLAPMLAPIMHHVHVYTHYFFVPNRLIWEEWSDFITGGKDGNSAPVPPRILTPTTMISGDNYSFNSLWDYFGLPILQAGMTPVDQQQVSALPFRAYQLIYDEYYRNQNLEDSLQISKASGTVSGAELTKILTLRDKGWEKDYFTSALPFAQRGPEVLIPIDGEVEYSDTSQVVTDNLATTGTKTFDATFNGITGRGDLEETGTSNKLRIENIAGVTNATGTIADLRKATKLQEFFELLARGGSRLTEVIRAVFGVTSSDARLQRPEYLGGGKSPVVISEVLSTYQDPDAMGVPQGNMAGHGYSTGTTNGFKYEAEEHGFFIGIMSIIPRTGYASQGIERMWSRADRFDYYWPQFAHIGEQAILNKEVYWDHNYPSTGANPNDTFGYIPRYAEYKFQNSTVHGYFRSQDAYWHMDRIFAESPSLNKDFVMAEPTKRIFAVETDPNVLYCQIFNRCKFIRLMPYYGTPQF